MELKEKFFAQYLNSLAPEAWVDLLIADHSFWEYCSCREQFNSRDWRKLVQWPPSGASDTNQLMKIKLVTKKRFQINGSGRKTIVSNGES